VLLLGLYFCVPLTAADRHTVLRWVLTIMVLGAAGWLIIREIRSSANHSSAPLARLILAIFVGLLAFALADYIIATQYPDEFASLSTRVDGLYFALATIASVGYGDVHAAGQLARVAVTAQMVFNLAIVGIAASLLTNRIQARVQSRQRNESDREPPETPE
jgi:hypothetical protein